MEKHRRCTDERMMYECLAQATSLSRRSFRLLGSQRGSNTTLDTVVKYCPPRDRQACNLVVLAVGRLGECWVQKARRGATDRPDAGDRAAPADSAGFEKVVNSSTVHRSGLVPR